MAKITLRGRFLRTKLKEADKYPKYYIEGRNKQLYRVSFEEALRAELSNEGGNKFDRGIEIVFEAAEKKTGKFRWGYNIRSAC